MRERDLRPCDLCGAPLRMTREGVLSPIAAGVRVILQPMFIDPQAVQQRAGLEVMFGGHMRPGASAIAGALGPPLDTLEPPELRDEALLCCACWTVHLAQLAETIEQRRCEREEREEACRG